jgi:transposase-like protein
MDHAFLLLTAMGEPSLRRRARIRRSSAWCISQPKCRIKLEKWLPAVWLIAGCKNGISSYEIHRGLGVTQKTGWFMLHRIRLAMQSGTFNKLSGEVEVDETFIGGKARNMHKGKRSEKIQGTGPKGKEIVFGMIERGGDVRVMHVEKRTKKELQSEIREHVEAGAAIFSDELLSYDGLESDYKHAVINHAVEYVNGNVHTNGMETSGRCSSAACTGPTSVWSRSIFSATLMNRRSASITARARTQSAS